MTNQQASQKIFDLSLVSSAIMFFNFFFSIISGPQFSHYVNIFALFITIYSIGILIDYRLLNFKSIASIIFNLSLGILGIYFKYGYTGWHYINLFKLMRPN